MNTVIHSWAGRAGPAAVVALAAALVLLAAPPSACGFINYAWNVPINGYVHEAARWTPPGVPTLADNLYYNASGAYTVRYTATVPQSALTVVGGGPVTFSLDSPHNTGELLIGAVPGTATLNLAYGSLQCGYLSLGLEGALTRLTLTSDLLAGSAQLTSASSGNRNYNGTGGDVIGEGGISYLDVFGGALYTCDRSGGGWPIQVAMDPDDIATIDIAGRNAMTLAYSTIRVVGGVANSEGMIAGVGGSTNIYVRNGGYLNVANNLMLAQLGTAYAYLNVGPTASFGTSRLNVGNHLWIGFNFYETVTAGHAELYVRGRSWVHVGGRCDVGDQDNDAGSLLRVAEGATFRVNGGIKFWPTAGMPLDLRGGLTHVNGGAFLWPTGKALVVSSQVGAPELAISGGAACVGPSTPAGSAQLAVGRGGRGTLRLTQPGTAFPMGAGFTTLGDSTGAVGTVIVDSLATLSGSGSISLGVRGHGELAVSGGSQAILGAMAVASEAGSTGQATVRGPGSLLQAGDRLWIGGRNEGAGGTGTVVADSGGVISVPVIGAVTLPRVGIYAGSSLALTRGGSLLTPSTAVNLGEIVLDDGLLQSGGLDVAASSFLRGRGRVVGPVACAGSLDPGAPSGSIGTLEFGGSITASSQAHLIVDLGDDGTGLFFGDLVEVDGTATLAGALDLRVNPGAPPPPGSVFVILTAATVVGTFTTVTWNGAPLAGEAIVDYRPDQVRVLFSSDLSAVDPDAAPGTVLRFVRASGAGADLAFALDLPAAAEVEVKVYDLRGRQVAVLQSGELAAGHHRFAGSTSAGRPASGVYLARAEIRQGGRVEVRTARTVVVR